MALKLDNDGSKVGGSFCVCDDDDDENSDDDAELIRYTNTAITVEATIKKKVRQRIRLLGKHRVAAFDAALSGLPFFSVEVLSLGGFLSAFNSAPVWMIDGWPSVTKMNPGMFWFAAAADDSFGGGVSLLPAKSRTAPWGIFNNCVARVMRCGWRCGGDNVSRGCRD